MSENRSNIVSWLTFMVSLAMLVAIVFATRSVTSTVAQAQAGSPLDQPIPAENHFVITNNIVLNSAMQDMGMRAKSEDDVEIRRAAEVAQTAKKDAMSALFAINHINWVVTKILTYNDPIVLEEEYRGLTADALNLRVIKDPELINTICKILDVIVEMRIEEKERAFLKDELDQGASDALADAVSSIRINGLNPISMIVSAVTSAASAALNYRKAKKALQAKFERQNWALDKNRMYYLNDLQKNLLRNFWVIVQRYPDLPESYRVSDKNIQMLVDHLKDDDVLKRMEFLQAFNDQFAGFQPYWYHRAATDYEVACDAKMDETIRSKAREDARLSLKNYLAIQIECGNILRRDEIAAKAALLQIALLSEDNSDDLAAYQGAIRVAVENSPADDWQAAYACAMVAITKLNDIEQAEKIIAPAISELDWQRRRRLVDWKDGLESKFESGGKGKVESLLATGDALYECRTLIANMAEMTDSQKNEQLRRICEDKNASVREKMFCFGAMGYKQALESLRPDVSRMRVCRRDGHYFVSVPFSWVIARGAVMSLYVNDQERREVGERQLEVRDDDKQYVLIDFGGTEGVEKLVSFRSRFDRPTRRADGAQDTDSYMVVVVVFAKEGLEYKPTEAKFGRWQRGTATTPAGWAQIQPSAGVADGKSREDSESITIKEN